MMRAGRLDRNIIVERLAETLDAFGAAHETWTTFALLRAEVVAQAAGERAAASGEAAQGRITFRIRFVEGITSADRILFAGEVHAIEEVREVGRRRALELVTISRGAP